MRVGRVAELQEEATVMILIGWDEATVKILIVGKILWVGRVAKPQDEATIKILIGWGRAPR